MMVKHSRMKWRYEKKSYGIEIAYKILQLLVEVTYDLKEILLAWRQNVYKTTKTNCYLYAIMKSRSLYNMT